MNLNHQHSKTRKMSIESLCQVLLSEGAYSHFEGVKKEIKALSQDKNSDVRKAFFCGVCSMINNFSIEALKKYEADLVSYMLYGLIDENEDIVAFCTKLLDEAGLKRKLLSLELNEPID